MQHERREHRRLSIHLPLGYGQPDGTGLQGLKSTTENISTGGLYFEADLVNGHEPPSINSLLTVELTIPPGEGHFPYEGRVRSLVEVVRCDVLDESVKDGHPGRRLGVAARFREPLKLAF